MSIHVCNKCGGLYATENLESFSGKPCECNGDREGYIDSLGNYIPLDATLRPYGLQAITDSGIPWFTLGHYRKPIDAYKAKRDGERFWNNWLQKQGFDDWMPMKFEYRRRTFKPLNEITR